MYQDQTLTCKDCGNQFVWTASEQEFYASKGFSAPLRCPDCRRKAKQAKGFDRGPRTMHKIVCANCGAEGEVPFEPRNPDNVLCADCFRKKRDGESGGDMGRTPAPAPVSDDATDDSAAAPMSDDMNNSAADDNKDEAAE